MASFWTIQPSLPVSHSRFLLSSFQPKWNIPTEWVLTHLARLFLSAAPSFDIRGATSHPRTGSFTCRRYRYKIANLLLWNHMYAQMFPKSPHLTSRMQSFAKKRDSYTCSTSVKLPTSFSGMTCTNVLSISSLVICGAISLPNWVLWLGCHLSLEKWIVPATWATSVLSLPVFTYRRVKDQRSWYFDMYIKGTISHFQPT